MNAGSLFHAIVVVGAALTSSCASSRAIGEDAATGDAGDLRADAGVDLRVADDGVDMLADADAPEGGSPDAASPDLGGDAGLGDMGREDEMILII